MPEAFSHFMDRKNVALFVKNKIVTESEYRARFEIELETYCKQINIEALTMIDMARKKIAPAVTEFVGSLTEIALSKKALSAAIPTSYEENLITSLSNKLVCFVNTTNELEDAVLGAAEHRVNILERAKYFREEVFSKMQELRAVGDSMETETASDYWPYPSYSELLFSV
jgi:glutamine synthetase